MFRPLVVLVSLALLASPSTGCTRDFELPSQGGELTVAEDGLTVAPLEAVTLTVSGSQGPFSYAFLQVGTGDPTLDPATGTYRAGALGLGRDIVEVQDGGGAVGRAELRTGPALTASREAVLLSAGARASFAFTGGKPPYQVHLAPDADAPSISDRPWLGTDEEFCQAPGAPVPCDPTADLVLTGEAELWYRAAQPLPRLPGDGQEVGYRVIGGDTERCTLDGVPWGQRQDTVTITDAVGAVVEVSLSSGDPLTAVLDSWVVHAGEERRILPAGGTGSYRFSQPFNRSGGAVDEHGGGYRPGFSANTLDGLLVVDSGGAWCFFEAAVRGQRYPTGHLTDAVLADLDGDGVDDLIGADANAADGRLWVGLNRPFAAPEVQPYVAAETLRPMAALDRVLPGRDLVLARDLRWGNAWILEPDFGGRLQAPVEVTGFPVESVAYSEAQNAWILAGNQFGINPQTLVRRLRWNQGTRDWVVENPPVSSIPVWSRLAALDLDRDGEVDLALLSNMGNQITLLWGPAFDLNPQRDPGDPVDPGAVTVDLKASIPQGAERMEVGDLDGDGVDDLVVGNLSTARLFTLYGTWGSRAAPEALSTQVVRSEETGDLAWWLVPDDRIAAVFYRDGTQLLEYRGTRGGWGDPTPAFFQSELGFRPVDLAVGDVNGDGAPDVVPVGGSLTSPVFLGSGEGNYGWRLRYGPGVPGAVVRGWFPAADGSDAEDDLLTVEGNVLRVWAGTLSALTLAADYDAGRSGELLGVLDVDGDGAGDALRYAPGSLFVQLRLGDAFDSYASQIADVPLASRARLADFDGDGEGETLVFTGGEVELALAGADGLDPAGAGLVVVEGAAPGVDCHYELVRENDTPRHLLVAVCQGVSSWEVHVTAPDSAGNLVWTTWGAVSEFSEGHPGVHALYQGRLVLHHHVSQTEAEMLLLDATGVQESVSTEEAEITGALVRDLDGDGSPELLVGTTRENLFLYRPVGGAMSIVGGAAIPGRPWGWLQLALDPANPHLVVSNGREVLLVAPEELRIP